MSTTNEILKTAEEHVSTHNMEELIEKLQSLPVPIQQLLFAHDVSVERLVTALRLANAGPVDPYAIASVLARVIGKDPFYMTDPDPLFGRLDRMIKGKPKAGPVTLQDLILNCLVPVYELDKRAKDLEEMRHSMACAANQFAISLGYAQRPR